jgi:hypothetical protein
MLAHRLDDGRKVIPRGYILWRVKLFARRGWNVPAIQHFLHLALLHAQAQGCARVAGVGVAHAIQLIANAGIAAHFAFHAFAQLKHNPLVGVKLLKGRRNLLPKFCRAHDVPFGFQRMDHFFGVFLALKALLLAPRFVVVIQNHHWNPVVVCHFSPLISLRARILALGGVRVCL